MAFSQFENNTVMAETSPDGSVGPTYTCVVENEPETIHRSDEVYSGRPINTRVTYSANRVCSEVRNTLTDFKTQTKKMIMVALRNTLRNELNVTT